MPAVKQFYCVSKNKELNEYFVYLSANLKNMRKIILLLCCFCSIALMAQPKYEIRAVWLTTLGGMDWPSKKANSNAGRLAQQRELCNLLDQLKSANINTVLFQTRLRGDVVYPSQFEPFAESLTGFTGRDPGYDPLAFAISECHKRGMELHAWFVTIPIGNERQVKLHGKQSVVRKHSKICEQFKGSWYLNPGNPATADYLSQLVREIVSKYDVDGVHFDYIRYPEHGKNFPDKASYRKYGKGLSLEAWRRNNITAIVRRLYTDVKQLKPWVKVSSSPIGKYNDTPRYGSRGWNAYAEVYQDAQRWMKEGIHDALFPMMYFQGNNFYPFALDWKENSNGRWIVPGLGVYFLDPSEQDWKLDEVVRQVYFTRQIGVAGQGYFRNRFLLKNTKGLLDELQEKFYVYPALIPPMKWMDSIPPAQPATVNASVVEGQVALKWAASADNHSYPVYYRVYASNHYPVDTENIRCLIADHLSGTSYTFQPAFPWKQKVYYAVTAVDRFGNESRPAFVNGPKDEAFPVLLQKSEILQMERLSGSEVYILTDATGREVLRGSQLTASDLEKIPAGLYILKLKKEDGRLVNKGVMVR